MQLRYSGVHGALGDSARESQKPMHKGQSLLQGDFVYDHDARIQGDAQTLFTFDLDADDKTRH